MLAVADLRPGATVDRRSPPPPGGRAAALGEFRRAGVHARAFRAVHTARPHVFPDCRMPVRITVRGRFASRGIEFAVPPGVGNDAAHRSVRAVRASPPARDADPRAPDAGRRPRARLRRRPPRSRRGVRSRGGERRARHLLHVRLPPARFGRGMPRRRRRLRRRRDLQRPGAPLPGGPEEHGRLPPLGRQLRRRRGLRRRQQRLPARRLRAVHHRVPSVRRRLRSGRELHRECCELSSGREEHGRLPAVGRCVRRGGELRRRDRRLPARSARTVDDRVPSCGRRLRCCRVVHRALGGVPARPEERRRVPARRRPL